MSNQPEDNGDSYCFYQVLTPDIGELEGKLLTFTPSTRYLCTRLMVCHKSYCTIDIGLNQSVNESNISSYSSTADSLYFQITRV